VQQDLETYRGRRPNMTAPSAAAPNHRSARDEYLENAVRSASPARIRLMLIERATQVAGALSLKYREGVQGTNEHSIHLLDLLGELLGGVANHGNELCTQVADLYVFMCQELVRAETASDPAKIDSIQEILRIEAETWREVCANEQPAAILADVTGLNQTMSSGLNLQG
jgi:flagellar secretion chaperone FliS